MIYDFHVHTSEYSTCAVSSADEICFRAAALGLAGIALTDHDVWWPLADMQRLQNRFSELTIMRGLEYSCPEGHFLVFLPNPENGRLPAWCSIVDIVRIVHRLNGIVIWAHPFRFNDNWPGWLDQVNLDGIEIASSNMHERAESMAREVASLKGIMEFRNSDSHHVSFLGRYGNELDTPITCTEDFVTFVRKHGCGTAGSK